MFTFVPYVTNKREGRGGGGSWLLTNRVDTVVNGVSWYTSVCRSLFSVLIVSVKDRLVPEAPREVTSMVPPPSAVSCTVTVSEDESTLPALVSLIVNGMDS